jgi:hypothetical protein
VYIGRVMDETVACYGCELWTIKADKVIIFKATFSFRKRRKIPKERKNKKV